MAAQIGVLGLGVMGSSLSVNLAEKTGAVVAGFDLSREKGIATEERAARDGVRVLTFASLAEFVGSLAAPRRIVLLVPAGPPVDACLGELRGLLEAGDVVMDGGNEWFENTERREREMAAAGVLYMGCGISGGAEGARHGPALMVGGPREAWELMSEFLLAIAARAEDGAPCVAYCGPGGAGNYVKMVHNGIEYADMQLIGEAYALCRATGRSADAIAAVFETWNKPGHPLRSFLVDITSRILRVREAETPLVDLVLDKAGSKGTGKWTVEEAAELGVPAPTVAAALDARYLSAAKSLRLAAAVPAAPAAFDDDLDAALQDALICAKICAYAQGLSLLSAAADARAWDLDLAAVLDCWRAGCIIRADLIPHFKQAARGGTNLLLSPVVVAMLGDSRLANWRGLLAFAVRAAVPVPALSASLAYFDSIRSARLDAAALIQAMRDCFGGHTYRRLDHPEDRAFTSDWLRLADERASSGA